MSVIYDGATDYAHAQIVRDQQYLTLLLNDRPSSEVSIDDPAELRFYYMDIIDAVVCVTHPDATTRINALHLGGAGCALARSWCARRTSSRHVAVEIDGALINLVRSYFPLPHRSSLKIRHEDAAISVNNMANRPARWDVIVRDIFDADSRTPRTLAGIDYYRHILKGIRPDGVVLSNIVGGRGTDAKSEIAAAVTAAEHWHITAIVERGDFTSPYEHNIIAALTPQSLDTFRLRHELIAKGLRCDIKTGKSLHDWLGGACPLP